LNDGKSIAPNLLVALIFVSNGFIPFIFWHLAWENGLSNLHRSQFAYLQLAAIIFIPQGIEHGHRHCYNTAIVVLTRSYRDYYWGEPLIIGIL